jgi:hypothetical protein
MSAVTAALTAISDSLMSEKEFLQKIKVSRATLNKYKSRKLITHFKAGRRVLYDAQSLEDFKNNCAQCVKATPREQRRK